MQHVLHYFMQQFDVHYVTDYHLEVQHANVLQPAVLQDEYLFQPPETLQYFCKYLFNASF
jgi:hypothetical protein